MGAFAPSSEAVAEVLARVARSGYVIQIEAPDGVRDYYLYTIGLTAAGKPELFYAGRRDHLPLAIALEATRELAEFSIRGIALNRSVDLEAFEYVDLEPEAVETLMGLAVAAYGEGNVRAVRLPFTRSQTA